MNESSISTRRVTSLLEAYSRGPLKTPSAKDLTEGVVVLSGFGFGWGPDTDVCGRTALYLDGVLVGMHHESSSPDNLYRNLAESLAKSRNIPWTQRQAHACWSREYREMAPGTLAEYDALTTRFYQTVSRAEALMQLSGDYYPPLPRSEGRLLSQAFGMSGGDLAEFDAWYAAWLKKHRFFCDDGSVYSDIEQQEERRRRRKSRTPEYAEMESSLRSRWLDYLKDVWDAEKPLDSVASRTMALG
jgi:hypothetical protein